MHSHGIICIGAAHRDRTARIDGDAVLRASNPVSVRSTTGGVALNIARNLGQLGNKVALATIVGTDSAGEAVLDAMRAAKVSTDLVDRTASKQGAAYTAVIDGNGELVIGLADLSIYDAITAEWLGDRQTAIESADALVVDANIPEPAIAALRSLLPAGIPVFGATVSPAKAQRLLPIFETLDGLFANRSEASVLVGRPLETIEAALGAAQDLHDRCNGAVCVTLGPQGVVAAGHGFTGHAPALSPSVLRDVNGAGDGFAAGVIDSLLANGDLEAALRRGLAVGSMTCEVEDRANPAVTRHSVAARIQRPDAREGAGR